MSSNALGKLKKLSDKELIGKVFLDKGFMSTSLESNSAFGGDVILEIHAPAGTHGLYVGHISAAGHYEEEVLFDMNQSMRIDFVTRDKFGRNLKGFCSHATTNFHGNRTGKCISWQW